MTSVRWWLGLAVVVVASCGGDKPPTGPSGGGGATRISLIAPHPTLDVGESQQLSLVLTGPDGVGHAPEGPVTWRSSNEAVYTVWAGGLAVAVAPGQATISASADGKAADIVLKAEARSGAARHVQGRVLDFASQAGLPGIVVGFGVNFATIDVQATTDANGAFALDVPAGELLTYLNGALAGSMAVRVGGPAFRGDLLGNGTGCVSRYGTVSDAQTFQPVAGATVTLAGKTSVTGPDGWYRMDFDCIGMVGFNTTFISATHPGHKDYSRVVGRGVANVLRLDIELQR